MNNNIKNGLIALATGACVLVVCKIFNVGEFNKGYYFGSSIQCTFWALHLRRTLKENNIQ